MFRQVTVRSIHEVSAEPTNHGALTSFVMPARVEHYLKNTGVAPMRFICFGVKERAVVKAWAEGQ